MANSPVKEQEDPMTGKGGSGEGKPKQQTDAQQRDGISDSKGAETPGTEGVSAAAVKSAQDAADKLGAGASRKEVEAGTDSSASKEQA